MSDILLERSGSGVARLTLNRPQRKNAFGPGMWDELRRLLHEVSLTASDRVLVITDAGDAVGAGMNLALGCDLIVAGERARFSEIFARRGLSLGFGGSWLLPRLVGMRKAKELTFLPTSSPRARPSAWAW